MKHGFAYPIRSAVLFSTLGPTESYAYLETNRAEFETDIGLPKCVHTKA